MEDLVQALTSAMTIRAQPEFDQRSPRRPAAFSGVDTGWPSWSFVVVSYLDSISPIAPDKLAAAQVMTEHPRGANLHTSCWSLAAAAELLQGASELHETLDSLFGGNCGPTERRCDQIKHTVTLSFSSGKISCSMQRSNAAQAFGVSKGWKVFNDRADFAADFGIKFSLLSSVEAKRCRVSHRC